MAAPHRTIWVSRGEVRTVLARVAGTIDAATLGDLVGLIAAHGEERVARIHQETGVVAGVRDWAVTTALACGLADVERAARLLVEDGEAVAEAATTARIVSRYAGWLLLAAVEADRVAATGRPASRWGEVLTELVDAPWCPDPRGLDGQMAAWGDDRVVLAVDELRWASQEREADRERAAVAAEIRRIVADSGLSQRAFAQRIGTSASRLSTYLNGRVTPSATMMLRVKRLERVLLEPTATRPGPALRTVPRAS